MKASQHIFSKREEQGLKIKTAILLLLLPFLIFLTGCWYTAISRYFNDGANLGSIGEWKFSVSVSAFFNANKKNFVKDYGRSYNELYDYKTHVVFWPITKIENSLSVEEQHDVRIDSLKVVFRSFIKTFYSHNTFEENRKQRERAYIEVNLGSVYIPPGTQHIDVTVYGSSLNSKDGLQPFELSKRLTYREKSERIFKYD